jgi:ribose/xylose/arabinose/galactoside ABC-type transport system permease subunit
MTEDLAGRHPTADPAGQVAGAPPSSADRPDGAAAPVPSGRAQGIRQRLTSITGIGPLLIALVLICLFLTLTTDSFLTTSNLTNIIVQTSVVGIAAVGGTLVIITSGIDLSVGSNVALSGMVAAYAMKHDLVPGGLGGVAMALLVGVLIGSFNGASTTVLRLTPFIATLAMLAMARGLTQQVSQGQTIFGFPASYTVLGNGSIAGIQAPVVVTVVVFLIGHVLLTRTSFGHQVYALGGNREAARLAGIPVRRVEFAVYALAGLCAGLAAVVLTGRLDSALASGATGLELQVIAAVVIGGTSLFGGRGSLAGTFLGVVLIGVIVNGLTLLNVNPFWQQFVQGAVIFVAVLLDALNTRRLQKSR